MEEDSKLLPSEGIEDVELQQKKRQDKILNAREARLAKIMSLASGRTIDPKEIVLDRTPSPSVSEKAAAGIGSMKEENLAASFTAESSQTSLNSGATVTSQLRDKEIKSGVSRTRHIRNIIIASVFFCIWEMKFNRSDMLASWGMLFNSSWQVLLSVFVAVEATELISGRASLPTAFSDFALYLFVIILIFKLFL